MTENELYRAMCDLAAELGEAIEATAALTEHLDALLGRTEREEKAA